MNRRVQHQIRPRQVQRKQSLIRASQTERTLASADGRDQHRCIGRHQPKPLPERLQARSIGTLVQRGPVLVVMLGGGDKSTQQADIAAAQALAASLED